MANNPFMPPTFKDTVPKGGWNTFTGPREDGPGNHVNPAETGPPVYYNGTNQSSIMNVSYVKPPRQTTPSAGDKNHSKIQ
jgi:hypothetical protein